MYVCVICSQENNEQAAKRALIHFTSENSPMPPWWRTASITSDTMCIMLGTLSGQDGGKADEKCSQHMGICFLFPTSLRTFMSYSFIVLCFISLKHKTMKENWEQNTPKDFLLKCLFKQATKFFIITKMIWTLQKTDRSYISKLLKKLL